MSPAQWREPQRIGDSARRQLARFGNPGSLADIVERWPAVVGDGVAANAWPARITRDGTLIVNTQDAVWAFELSQRAPEISARLEAVASRVKFVPGPLPSTPSPSVEAAPRAVPKPRREHVERATELAATIDNEELRERVVRAVAASLAQAADGRTVW